MTSCRRNCLDLQFKPQKKLVDNRLPSAPDVTKELYAKMLLCSVDHLKVTDDAGCLGLPLIKFN